MMRLMTSVLDAQLMITHAYAFKYLMLDEACFPLKVIPLALVSCMSHRLA